MNVVCVAPNQFLEELAQEFDMNDNKHELFE